VAGVPAVEAGLHGRHGGVRGGMHVLLAHVPKIGILLHLVKALACIGYSWLQAAALRCNTAGGRIQCDVAGCYAGPLLLVSYDERGNEYILAK